MSLSRERLQQLEKIEDNVVNVIQCASQSLLELSKEQPSQEYILKTTQEFLQGDIVRYSKVPNNRCSVNIVMEDWHVHRKALGVACKFSKHGCFRAPVDG